MKMKNDMWNKFFFALFTMLMATTMAGSAAAVTISATVEKNQFTDTTPVTGVRDGIPGNLQNTFIVNLGMLNTQITSHQRTMRIKAPGVRTVVLKAAGSIKTYQAKISVTYVGGDLTSRVNPSFTAQNLGGCSNVGPSSGGYAQGKFMWKVNNPDSPDVCAALFKIKNLNGNTQMYGISSVTMAFEVDATELLKNARPGTYTGSIQYNSNDPGGHEISGYDRDMATFDLDFEFKVTSDMYVALSQPSATLAPKDGWDRYTDVLPHSLEDTVTVTGTSSHLLSVTLRCQKSDSNKSCLISNRNSPNISVPLRIDLLNVVSAYDKPFKDDNTFTGVRLGRNRTVYLKFSVDRAGIEEMAKHRGVPYSGDVTLIFDAN